MIETNGEFVAEQLVSIDETSKDGRTFYRRYSYALHGQEGHLLAMVNIGPSSQL